MDHSTTKRPIIDFSVLLSSTANDKKLSEKLLSNFIADILERKIIIQSLWKNQNKINWEALGNQIHKLNGSARFSGLPCIQDIATQLEKMIQEKKTPQEIEHHLEKLFDTIEKTAQAYQQKDY